MDGSLVTVAGLHALIYCERLFFLEEVERLRVQDAAVFAGRALHVEIEQDEGELSRHVLESQTLGLQGRVDVLRRRDGALVPYEHKRGRSAPGEGPRAAWDSDRIQVAAYALLLEESFGQHIPEGRVRYHADGVTVRVPIDDAMRGAVLAAIVRARELGKQSLRPPVTSEPNRCARCSLAPVCLPEEARLAADPKFRPVRLLPQHPTGESVHVTDPSARIGRRGEELCVRCPGAEELKIPIANVGSVTVYGNAQITSQALRLCVDREVQVHWLSGLGAPVASLAPTAPTGHRHLRQLRALDEPGQRLTLARRLVGAKVASQLRFVLRATRGRSRDGELTANVQALRRCLRHAASAASAPTLLGVEGSAAAAYFAVLPALLSEALPEALRITRRSKRPPKDPMNALLSFGYGLLYRMVAGAIVNVGLHPGLGFYHVPRAASHPLALDLMELFRVALVDMPIVAALNRRTFDADADFRSVPGGVWLTDTGRAKLIEVFERRCQDEWRHDIVGYSLSYARIVELEVRLLEKEWLGEGGLFARFRIR
jgi:CRISPR-associated protein Cas1